MKLPEESFLAFARLCENSVHGSTRLTTNGVVSLNIKHLSVRPERVEGFRESFQTVCRSE
jgi:hypothetical protein